jgi:hypothetical protein
MLQRALAHRSITLLPILDVIVLPDIATFTIIHMRPIANILTNNHGKKLVNPPPTASPFLIQVVCNHRKSIQISVLSFGFGADCIPKKSRVLLLSLIGPFIAICSVCNIIILMLIANTGNTGAKISHNILHALISPVPIRLGAESFPHHNLISSFSP